LASQRARRPKLHRCHAGLLYARGRIEVEDEFVAMVFAGQIVVDGALEEIETGIEELASACNLPVDRLREALPSIRRRDAEAAERLMDLLERLGETLSGIGRQQLVLLRKLRHIAEVTAL
jgi:ligand-binding sensor protein